MKIGYRIPSIHKRIIAHFSVRRAIRHRGMVKAPRGFGFIFNLRRAIYNWIYRKTTRQI